MHCKCIVNEIQLSLGKVIIDGKNACEFKSRDLAKKTAYIPQNHYPLFPFSVLDIVLMGRTAHIGYFASPGREDKDIAMEKLKFLGIEHLSDKPYTDISGGERQLVMIASALAQEPEVLIFDEPTAHLDFGNQFKFLQLVKRLRDKKIGVIMTTHFPDHPLDLDCQTIILNNGHIEKIGMAKEIINENSLSRLYGINVKIESLDKRKICVPWGGL